MHTGIEATASSDLNLCCLQINRYAIYCICWVLYPIYFVDNMDVNYCHITL